jgi:hypothetical protein
MRRISIRTLMVLIAIIAIATTLMLMLKRSRDYRVLAEMNAALERESVALASLGKVNGDSHRVATGNQLAAYHRALWIKYEQAARSPWSHVEPDPPRPHPPATAILKGAP